MEACLFFYSSLKVLQFSCTDGKRKDDDDDDDDVDDDDNLNLQTRKEVRPMLDLNQRVLSYKP